MLDQVEVSRVLDILGNRNRRRIIGLLRQKPCFVTEISDRLMLSPKAVIEHLQLMEREEILSSRMDERRRKYYYLAHDISVMVSLQKQEMAALARPDKRVRFRNSLRKLRQMVVTREDLVSHLEHLEHDIDQQIHEITEMGREMLQNEQEIDVVIALSHCDLTSAEMAEVTSVSSEDLALALEALRRREIVEKDGTYYRIRGMHAEQSIR
jgi:ArsR family transcriptional regulator